MVMNTEQTFLLRQSAQFIEAVNVSCKEYTKTKKEIIMRKLSVIFAASSLLLSISANAEEHKVFDEPNVSEHTLLIEYKGQDKSQKSMKGSGFYYVHCIDENKRIGNYNSDLTVINNRASHHSRTKNHNTKVYEK